MKKIAANLESSLVTTPANDKIAVLVTTNGVLPKTFKLKAFEGLEGIYHGQVTRDEINKLAKHAKVKTVELDEENRIL
jgi:hypothetical protein